MTSINALKRSVKEILDLSSKSAILADPKSKLFCKQYYELKKCDANLIKTSEFFKSICEEHGVRKDRVYNTISLMANSYKNQTDFSKKFNQINYDRMSSNLKPIYYDFFQNLGRVKDGVRTLVKMRQDVLSLIEDKSKNEISYEEELKIMNHVLKSLLTIWFSTGLLNIQRVNWNSSASIVEKVAHYESVHQIKTLSDLKNRLSASRRCFIYTHSTMPYEPLVILHIALTNNVSSNIKDLIKISPNETDKEYETFDINSCTNAIFYSVNSCQKGLQQVDLGNALIKSCVHLLLKELPNLKHFHTLSPIPKFRQWLDLKLKIAISHNQNDSNDVHFFPIDKCLRPDEKQTLCNYFQLENTDNYCSILEKLKSLINSTKYRTIIGMPCDNKTEDNINIIVEAFLKRACSFYLCKEKKNGYAFNSVCNFHLKNGAQIYRINSNADLSENGWNSSYGLMVNYAYNLHDLDSNCVNYLIEKNVKTSDFVNKLLANFS